MREKKGRKENEKERKGREKKEKGEVYPKKDELLFNDSNLNISIVGY